MILVNAHNIKQGGGVSVLYNFIDYLYDTEQVDVLVIVPNVKLHNYKSIKYSSDSRFNFHFIPSGLIGIFYKFFFLNNLINNKCKKHKIKKIFSLGNIAVKSDVYQILLIQNAFPFINEKRIYDSFPFIFRIYIKTMNLFIVKNLKFANKIFVQTNFIKKELINQYHIDEQKILIFPNLINKITKRHSVNSLKEFNSSFRLLFLSNFYPHKNFNILKGLIKLIFLNKLPIQISITLSQSELKKSHLKPFLNEYPNIIKNIGPVNSSDIESTYYEHEALFLPSIVESFSTNYVEAFLYNKTIITSNLPFATEVCEDSAFYFDPLDINDIYRVIEYCFFNNEIRDMKIALYEDRISKLNLNNQQLIYKSFFYA